ncbi:hypothetical protein [Nocardioides sp. LS1]|nr:hypothetical protein [Nocardioides sp. LS1]
MSQNRSEVNTANSCSCSTAVSAFGGVGRDGLRAGPWATGCLAP